MPDIHDILRSNCQAPQAVECGDLIEPLDPPEVKPATLTIDLPSGETVIITRDSDGAFAQTERNGSGVALCWSRSILRVLDEVRDYIAREVAG